MQSKNVACYATILSVSRLASSANVGGSDFLMRRSGSASVASVNASVSASNHDRIVYGKNKCPCVGIDNLPGYYATNIDYYHTQYPLEAGSSCKAWELGAHPECKDGVLAPDWCSQRWCYVDPCNCELEELPRISVAGVEYQGSAAYWSYETCGFVDFYSKDQSPEACVVQPNQTACAGLSKCAWDGKRCGGKAAIETCKQASQLDESVYGLDDCRCVGLSGKEPGKAWMYIDDEQEVAYPPDVGATCKAWEAETHPDCMKEGETPAWCSTQWCFVDPCKCKTAQPPKMVMEANRFLQFQGKTAFWSPETCGNADTWAADHSGEYCVTQKSENECTQNKRCLWDGKNCLGKALVEICDEQSFTGKMGFDKLYSGSMRLRSFAAILLMLRILIQA